MQLTEEMVDYLYEICEMQVSRVSRRVDEDLVQEGMLGVVRAAASYKPVEGTPFEAWAVMKMKWTITDAIRMRLGRGPYKIKYLEGLTRFSQGENGEDGVPGEIYDPDDFEIQEQVEWVRSKLTDEELSLSDCLHRRLLREEIARRKGCSRAWVTLMASALRKKVQKLIAA